MSSTMENMRWRAVVTYRTEGGPLEVDHHFEELEDLHEIIERGPHWGTIIDIKITYHGATEIRTLTVEEAQTL